LDGELGGDEVKMEDTAVVAAGRPRPPLLLSPSLRLRRLAGRKGLDSIFDSNFDEDSGDCNVPMVVRFSTERVSLLTLPRPLSRLRVLRPLRNAAEPQDDEAIGAAAPVFVGLAAKVVGEGVKDGPFVFCGPDDDRCCNFAAVAFAAALAGVWSTVTFAFVGVAIDETTSSDGPTLACDLADGFASVRVRARACARARVGVLVGFTFAVAADVLFTGSTLSSANANGSWSTSVGASFPDIPTPLSTAAPELRADELRADELRADETVERRRTPFTGLLLGPLPSAATDVASLFLSPLPLLCSGADTLLQQRSAQHHTGRPRSVGVVGGGDGGPDQPHKMLCG
jgi:hypothetical protein